MTLYPFQEDALNATQLENRVAYYMDMGLGKTFIGAEKMKRMSADVNLLICQKSKIHDWIQHFQIHYPAYKHAKRMNEQIVNKQEWV